MNSKKSFILTIVITALVTCLITNIVNVTMLGTDSAKAIQKISMVKKMLSNYELFEVDEKKLSDYASMAMAAAIDDPYTVYFPKDEFNAYKGYITSSYVGIGATIGADVENDCLVIISSMDDSPAQKAGVKSGDILRAIDQNEYNANEISQAATYLKNGKEGTEVILSMERDGESFDLKVTREKIVKSSVKSKMLENNVGYLRITGFDSKNGHDSKDTYDEFSENMSALETAGMKSLILDLRDNPGGDLNVVCKIADTILPEGIITYTKDKHGKQDTIKSDAKEMNIPIVVLVNGGSASASEVLTGALKDYKKATVVGEKTYGKGIVQTVFPFSDGSGMSITTARYFTPSGVCIHEIGIEPDYIVENTSDKAVSELDIGEDVQLQKAIEIISKQAS